MANELRFDPFGFAYLNVAIKPSRSTTLERVSYKIDTGANCTTISYKKLFELGYDEN